jgi:osmotically-inducible protein OsmY
MPKNERSSEPFLAPCRVVERPLGIDELAESRLRSNSYLALKNVSCELSHGRLVLRGCLPSYYLKQVAQEVVAVVAGSTPVVNQISVLDVQPAGCRR